MKQASLYAPGGKGAVKCTACSRYCAVSDGKAGFCRTRVNRKGALYSLVYGKPCAIGIDPIEKKPFYHFLPGTTAYSIGTFGCNFACEFCQNWELSQAPKLAKDGEEFNKLIEAIPTREPRTIAEEAIRFGCASVAYTYNEPAIFAEYAVDCGREAKGKGLRNVFVSNGYESRETLTLAAPFLDGINVDLKSFSDAFYRRLCKASLEPVLQTIKLAKKLGIWVEVTTLVIPGENDSQEELKAAADFLASVDKQMPWHVTAFHPDYNMAGRKPTPIATLLKARELGIDAGLRHVYVGNVRTGNSNDYENTVCQKCGVAVIRRRGFSVLENKLADGRCPCGARVAGVWQ